MFEHDLVLKALQATDKRLGEAWCPKALVVVGAEFAEEAVVLKQVVGQGKDLVSNGDDGSLASAFRRQAVEACSKVGILGAGGGSGGRVQSPAEPGDFPCAFYHSCACLGFHCCPGTLQRVHWGHLILCLRESWMMPRCPQLRM